MIQFGTKQSLPGLNLQKSDQINEQKQREKETNKGGEAELDEELDELRSLDFGQ